ncbi:MAG: hypothetical protein V3U52_01990 [Thermoplasmata archaeon]
MTDRLYERVKDIISRDSFEVRIEEEMEAWGGLLEEETAALLVVDELGRNELTFRRVSDLYEGGEALLAVRLDRIGTLREFTRKDGSQGRVVNLMVSDASGNCRLVLWDEEVEMVTAGRVEVGSPLRVIDGYVRRGRYGIEVSTGKWGVILPQEP